MRALVDTQLAVWAIENDPRLGRWAKALITAQGANVFASVSLWEIAIKHPLRYRQRAPIRMNAAEALIEFTHAGMFVLPVSAAHAIAVDGLPSLHGDPFDRLIVAQAIAEDLPLLTRDPQLRAYSELVELV